MEWLLMNIGFLLGGNSENVPKSIVLTVTHYWWLYHLVSWCISIQFSCSHVQLFVTPWTVANQVPLSMEFSRKEHWSGLPFSLLLFSQKRHPVKSTYKKWPKYRNWESNWDCVCLVTQLFSTLCDPMESSLPDSSVHGILQAWIMEQVAIS